MLWPSRGEALRTRTNDLLGIVLRRDPRRQVRVLGPCALEGQFRTSCAHCRERRGRAVRTGGAVPAGLCAAPAATSVHTPVKTWSAVYTAGHDGKPGVQTPVRTRTAVHTVGPCALEGQFLPVARHEGPSQDNDADKIVCRLGGSTSPGRPGRLRNPEPWGEPDSHAVVAAVSIQDPSLPSARGLPQPIKPSLPKRHTREPFESHAIAPKESAIKNGPNKDPLRISGSPGLVTCEPERARTWGCMPGRWHSRSTGRHERRPACEPADGHCLQPWDFGEADPINYPRRHGNRYAVKTVLPDGRSGTRATSRPTPTGSSAGSPAVAATSRLYHR